MKNSLLVIFVLLAFNFLKAQSSCTEIMNSIKAEHYGTTYTSYSSDAISKVTFYDVSIDYQTYYFAIVCFKKKYSFNCNEYIYQVASNTKFKYATNYMASAGEAFWNYIQPYNENLNCAPDF